MSTSSAQTTSQTTSKGQGAEMDEHEQAHRMTDGGPRVSEGARLTVEVPEIRCTVAVDRWEHEETTRTGRHGRYVYRYAVTVDPSGDPFTFTGADLRSGSCSDEVSPNLAGHGLATLLRFLSHGAEQYAAGMGDEPADGWTFTEEQSEQLYRVGADALYLLADELAGSEQ